MAASSNAVRYNSPCAACKFLRRKCMPDCIFGPYFPPEEPLKFTHVHKIFGASNVSKLLNDVLPHQREDTVSSLVYEAEARVRDPVYGCVGAISFLQLQVERLQKELDAANAELVHFACGCCNHCYAFPTTTSVPIYPVSHYPQVPRQMMRPVEIINTRGAGISTCYQTPSAFSYQWNDKNVSAGQGGAAGRQGP